MGIPDDNTGTKFGDSVGEIRTYRGREFLYAGPGQTGHLIWGARDRREPGRYRVEFELGRFDDPTDPGSPICATLDVCTNDGRTILAERFLKLSDLGDEPGMFAMEFTLQAGRDVEYRVYGTGKVGLLVSNRPRVTPVAHKAAAPSPKNSQQRRWENEAEFLDGYLRNVSGIIHVGANLGQERAYYRLFGLDVAWIEPISEVFERLVDNIAGLDRQRAFNVLLTDREGGEYQFNIANNNGASSSILPFDKHAELWPDVEYSEVRSLRSTTLAALMRNENLSTDVYQALTMDVEGAELLVLQGAAEMLSGFRYVKAEVADFTPRTGSPVTSELDAFLTQAGFRQLIRRPFGSGPGGKGTYWDIVWKRVSADEPFFMAGIDLPMTASAWDVSGLDKVHD